MRANLKRLAMFTAGCVLFIGALVKAFSEMKTVFDFRVIFEESHAEATIIVVAIALLFGVAGMLHSIVASYED